MATVSAIIPNHNHAEELRTSLAALTGQTRPFDQIIIVDDASTDHSLCVIDGFKSKFPQIQLLRNPSRLSVPDTVNVGLRAATGDYVVLASADERVESTMCGTLLGCMEKYPHSRVATSQYAEWNPATGLIQPHGDESPLGMWFVDDAMPRFFAPDELPALTRKRFVWLGINTAMFEREALMEVGGFLPELRWHSDWFAIYALALRHGFCAIREPLASFHYSPDSYSARGMSRYRSQFNVVTAVQTVLHKEENADLLAIAKETPALFSLFMRHMIPAIAVKPQFYDMLGPVLTWWAAEVLRGRRPAILQRLLTGGRSSVRGQNGP